MPSVSAGIVMLRWHDSSKKKGSQRSLAFTVPRNVAELIEDKAGHWFQAELTDEGIFFRYIGPNKREVVKPKWAQ